MRFVRSMLAASLALPVLAITGTAEASTTSGCAAGTLPTSVLGRPATLKAGAANGAYVWHDSHGWHLAVTHPGTAKRVFGIVITASRPISYTRVSDERNDITKLSSDRRTLTIRFVNYGRIDAVDFGADCAGRVRFAMTESGHTLSPNAIYLGRHGVHPTSDPFAVQRS